MDQQSLVAGEMGNRAMGRRGAWRRRQKAGLCGFVGLDKLC